MKSITFGKSKPVSFLVEQESFEGVKKIADIVAEDVCLVVDDKPEIVDNIQAVKGKLIVLMATDGHSKLLTKLEQEGKLDLKDIRGKREVYKWQLLEKPYEEKTEIEQVLVIAGSDKRGTIYGMFRLSEKCGVSPLIYFGDAIPEKKDEITIEVEVPFVSKEPSVEYRGFFINDEWPAFGNWAYQTFDGINAKAYDKIFQLLLRLKGNYLWPAMWNSSFSQDGPGIENAKLADIYGVVMGTSHHEPLFRAGKEWQDQYKNYGDDNTWSFVSNGEAIKKFWVDGVKRNKDFESVITIGMRGENDSKLLSEDATLKDNIEVVKKAIKAQDEILDENLEGGVNAMPRMLAIYKEVEDYYYGDDTCEGLKDWDELKDVIFLLSDDNYGNLRRLPSEEERKHPGGFGMYYHFDYHGGPISYEWTNTNRLEKVWEQMSHAYEFGVRKMWIVNVGDLKEAEYPLCYFLDLAYDFEKYGSKAPNKTDEYVRNWIDMLVGGSADKAQKEDIKKVIDGYTKWNGARTPESMNEHIYNPVNENEAERVISEVTDILETAERLHKELKGQAKMAFDSVIYYAAAASVNLVLAWAKSAINLELANRGCLRANKYADEIKEHIEKDALYVEEFHKWNNGKWNHCLDSAHCGFKNWDDYDYSYPAPRYVYPVNGHKAIIGFKGSAVRHLGTHWADTMVLENDEFTRPDAAEVILDLDIRGKIAYSYEIECDEKWIICKNPAGRVEPAGDAYKSVTFAIDKDAMPKESGNVCCDARVHVKFDNGQVSLTRLKFIAKSEPIDVPAGYALERQGKCCILAEHFIKSEDAVIEGLFDGCGHVIEEPVTAGFKVIHKLGREYSAVKAFPVTAKYESFEKAPKLTYGVVAQKDGAYDVYFYLLSRNPSLKGQKLRFYLSANEGEAQVVQGVSDTFYTEHFDREWAMGVLDHARVVKAKVNLNEGCNTLTIGACEPGTIFEKMVLVPEGEELAKSYFGPLESCIE